MKKLSKESRPIRIIGFWKEENGKIFVNSFNGEYELDEVASIIWKMCDGRNKIDEIIKKLKKIFKNTGDTEIESDVVELLLDMEKDDLLILDYDPLFPHKKLHFLKDVIKK